MVRTSLLEGALKSRFREIKDGEHDYKVCCPYCHTRGRSRDTNFKLWVSKRYPYWHCFRCDAKGKLGQLIPMLAPLTDARVAVAEAQDVERMPADAIPLEDLPDAHPAVRYLAGRGYEEFPPGLKFSFRYMQRHASGRIVNYGPRLLIPITHRGSYAGFQARALNDEQEPKYVTALGFKKSRHLYNFDMVIPGEDLVITEGIFDSWSVGLEQACCAFGKELSLEQAQLVLSKPFRRIIVLFDDDAVKKSRAAALHLARYRTTIWYGVPAWKDPGSASPFVLRDFLGRGLSPWRSVGLQKVI